MISNILKLIKDGNLTEAYKQIRRYGKITKDFSFESSNGSHRVMNVFFELTDWNIQMYNGSVIDIEFNQRRF